VFVEPVDQLIEPRRGQTLELFEQVWLCRDHRGRGKRCAYRARRDRWKNLGFGLSSSTHIEATFQDHDFPERRLLDGLKCQLTVESLVPRVREVESCQVIIPGASEWDRNKVFVLAVEDHREKSSFALLVVDVIVDDVPFPEDATALVRRDLSLDALEVRLRADDENELGALRSKLLLAPSRPTLGRSGLVLIDLGLDALSAKLIGERQDPLGVLLIIVAVADESLGLPEVVWVDSGRPSPWKPRRRWLRGA
jgi:hypothetical protein